MLDQQDIVKKFEIYILYSDHYNMYIPQKVISREK